MTRGINLPVTPTPEGRAPMIDDEAEQTLKIIMIGLCDCTSANPFQELGLPLDNIFDINDQRTRGRVQDYIERFFRKLQTAGRARLVDVTSSPELSEQGEAVLDVHYIDLKTRTPRDVRFGIGSAGTARILED